MFLFHMECIPACQRKDRVSLGKIAAETRNI